MSVVSNPFSDNHTDDASTAPTSPVSNGTTEPVNWNNRNLVYLLSVLKPEEVVADKLAFVPSLEVLEELTYPFNLQIHKKAASTRIHRYPYSKDAPIGTSRPHPRTLVAQSSRGCLSPELARRSLAENLLSDNELVDATIARYNALWAIHSTGVAVLESILRAICEMITVADDEWQGRLDQLCGMVAGDYTGQCVDGDCSVETRLEYYFLTTGKIALEDWIRCVGACLGMDSDKERAAHAEVYDEARSFLCRASYEMMD
ncbi:hypothetical protein G6011_00610 [Alternaria panax]|uniref:Uncharacterized protein n=1 Tax=Alternaria panax TaxID=48097 RepID=A0AAD4NV77_9PLEO|nr:hypothetical protein G6011_00610 [Alternaria panax]